MGIARGCARLLLDECAQRPFRGSVIQLGRQAIYFRGEDVRCWAQRHNVTLADPAARTGNRNKPLVDKEGFLDDGTFFSMLGFDTVHSCDYSDIEQPTYCLDLNRPIPDELHGRYDAVFDGGTVEHVFDLPAVLANIHALLKPGGRIVHAAPSTNHVDHGFYMFSPTLFYDYYTVNGYKIVGSRVFEYTRRHDKDPWKIYDYRPGVLDHLAYGGFDRGSLLGIFLVARKEPAATHGVVPQQGDYLRAWRKAASQSGDVPGELAPSGCGANSAGSAAGQRAPAVRVPSILGRLARRARRLALKLGGRYKAAAAAAFGSKKMPPKIAEY